MAITRLAHLTLDDFLNALASKTPAPGGGATAAVVGAVGVAQALMVVEYSIGKKDLAEHRELLSAALAKLTRARQVLLTLADEDGTAYAALNALQKLPEGDPVRVSELPAAAKASAMVPMFVLATCVEALETLAGIKGKTNRFLESDLRISAIALSAAAQSSRCNVEVNLPLIEDVVVRESERRTMELMLKRAGGLEERVRA
ncbi:MAG: cyclodeaminase/cyclohydrolase family protein [Phycisphaerales bacterium]|nr:cyclodeaminase/cyclohydrolase family protein [Phycisphaerales bacterium]